MTWRNATVLASLDRARLAVSRVVPSAIVALALPLGIGTSPPLSAQGIRITGSTSARYFELLPLAQDSVQRSRTIGTGTIRDSPFGTVTCPQTGDACYYYRSLDREHSVPLTQDLEATAWGFGTGVSAYVHVRGRSNAAGVKDLYPRQSDHFDALAAYLELDRGRLLARAGRQWITSGLGFTNFDGGSVAVQATPHLSVRGLAGWSLVQGLSEPATSDALAAADLLPPDRRGVLLGASTRWRADVSAISAEYQREIRTDRAGLYSERVAVAGTTRLWSTALDASIQADLATGALNELMVRASRRLPLRLDATVQARQYTPFFPLWTIWGAFAPVGYREGRGELRWRMPSEAVTLSAGASYRRFEDTNAGLTFLPIRDDGWHVEASAGWRPAESWLANVSYDRDIGFGASRSDGSAAVRWTPNDRGFVGLTGTAFQSIYEFRVGSGTVTGVVLDGGFTIHSDLRVVADVALYQHIGKDTPSVVDWSQRRATLRLEWSVGRDPGRRSLAGH